MKFLIVFFIFHFHLQAVPQNNVIRAAIEIGMGGPKLQVAEIDTNNNKIIKILCTHKIFVNFYKGLSDNLLSHEIMDEGINALKKLIFIANSFQAKQIAMLSTAALRLASNGQMFANEIEKETGIEVHIVDQILEGKLAFLSILSKTVVDPDGLIVWDIGGGSMQFATRMADEIFVDGINIGIGKFVDYILETIQQKNKKEFFSPNPLSFEDISKALEHAQQLSKKINPTLKDKINNSTLKVFGTGTAFGLGITGLLSGKNPFSVQDLSQVVTALEGKTDADFGKSDFAIYDSTIAILVLGLMQSLNIQEMQVINENNADAALIYQPFWHQKIVHP